MKPYPVLFTCLVLLIPAAAADVWNVDIDNTSGTDCCGSCQIAFAVIDGAFRTCDSNTPDDMCVAQHRTQCRHDHSVYNRGSL